MPVPDLTDNLDELMFLRARPQVSSVTDYETVLEAHVQVRFSHSNVGCTLRDLNQRFAQVNKEFHLPVREVIRTLTRLGRFKLMEEAGQLVVFSQPQVDEFLSSYPIGSDEQINAFQSLIERTVDFYKRKKT